MELQAKIVIIVIMIIIVTDSKIQKNNEKVEIFIKNGADELKTVNFKCQSLDISYMLWLKDNKSNNILLHCVYHSLNNSIATKSQKQYVWTLLSEIYKQNKEFKKSNFALKQIKNKNVFMKNDWYFLGPFQIGKSELDGNPIDSFAKDYLINNRWNPKVVAYSELSKSAVVKWKIVQSDNNGAINISPQVDWNDLVMSLKSVAVAEWQGVLVNEFIVNEGQYKVQCLGVNVFYIDDLLMNGDIYHRQQYWYPLSLTGGIHIIKVPIRTNGQIVTKCTVEADKDKSLLLHQASFVPDLVDQNLFSHYIAIVITNMNLEVVTIKKVSIKEHNLDLKLSVHLEKEMHFQPGQVSSINLQLSSENKNLYRKCQRQSYRITLLLDTNLNLKSKEFSFQIRCRNSDQSFLFTFVDHDNSIQHAAAVRPLTPCLLDSCPVLLSLHGTGVSAQNQADSYKRKKGNAFIFGVEKLWLLAPTRHGAHNWEGPGELTSMAALKALSDLTKNSLWLAKPANDQVVVFAGHSMGGHGAWQLSIHHPDKALAVISAAGWLSKEHYGDSNLFYHHDVSISHTDPMVKSIQESCIVENQVDKHASNLKGIPVMIRIGSNDRTVHPYFTRRMYRLLKENQVNVTYKEFPGKEHWWWDTKTENDGGVTNDLQMRTFSTYAVEQYEKRIQEKSVCNENGCTEEVEKSKYHQKQNRRDEGKFSYIFYNPASFQGGRGVRVVKQKIPFRRSQYDITITSLTVAIVTINIKCFIIYEPSIDPIHWTMKSIIIDAQHLGKHNGNLPWRFCFNNKSWDLITDPNHESKDRYSKTYGPARRIAEKPFSIVVCNCESKWEIGILQNAAIFLANLFHLTSDSYTDIEVTDTLDKNADRNVILIGTDDCISKMVRQKLISLFEDHVQLGDCMLSGRNLSALYLQPRGNDNLMLILTGHTAESIRNNVMKLSIPTIPPMTRSPFSNLLPDYVILSPEVLSKGPGGFACTGFWNNFWNYDAVTSSCSCV